MKKLVRCSLIAVLVLLGGARNAQAGFDAIVPSQFQIDTVGYNGTGLSWWGWIVAQNALNSHSIAFLPGHLT